MHNESEPILTPEEVDALSNAARTPEEKDLIRKILQWIRNS